MKWAQRIKNYQKYTLGGPMMKQCLAVLFFYVLPRHTNIMTDKGSNPFDECTAKCVHLFSQEEEGTFCLFQFESSANLLCC